MNAHTSRNGKAGRRFAPVTLFGIDLWDALRTAIYRHIIFVQANLSKKLFTGRASGKAAGRCAKLCAEFSARIEMKAHARLWCQFLRQGSAVKLMKLCRIKQPSISEVKAQALDSHWTESGVDSLDHYAAFPANTNIVLGRDNDGYFVFGDGPSQIVDAKTKTRYTDNASGDRERERNGVLIHLKRALSPNDRTERPPPAETVERKGDSR